MSNTKVIFSKNGSFLYPNIVLSFHPQDRQANEKFSFSEHRLFLYPDIVVNCHPQDRQAIKFLQVLSLIVEMLFPGT